jgi:choline dehydrogenase-like flavoprotein
LAALGIAPVADLPVGRALQDHPSLLIVLPSRDGLPEPRGGRVSNCLLRYASKVGAGDKDDMFLVPNNGHPPLGGKALLVSQLEQVFSRGRLTLRSSDPLDEPYIEQGVLTDKRDLDRMIASLELVREVAARPAFRGVLDGPLELPAPEEVPAVVVDSAHLSCTCPMGATDDALSVLDPDCRVLGVDGLRVVDASIFPSAPRANPNLTVIMAAEHASARIRATRRP